MLAWIDRHAAVFIVAGLVGLGGVGLWNLSIAQEVRSNAQNQLVNRATNVETWCVGGINEGRQYDRRFVESFHAHYTLSDKDCAALIRKTLESPKRKAVLTRAGNPLTYRIATELGLRQR